MAGTTSAGSGALSQRLAERLREEPDVIVAYLFGSRTRGASGPLSDVDVAVLLDGSERDRHGVLVDAVADVTGSERADVVILNDAPVTLAYRVLRDGMLLVDRDPVVRVRHWVRTVDRYLDMAPMREILAEGTRRRLREGRFGRS